MDSKKVQKLSKATIATVLATSGVIVAMPQPTNAYSFSDLNPYADYYEPILDLANRKIATGYSDGTFKPNEAITREDAAKMLALTIDVNITNPKNPGFKDVPMSNPNYRYIAALAEAGIISGYSDKTFKPKEPITRGQMAKILTLGFRFGVSSKLNHGFKDVSDKNSSAYFIQTLYDLNVTKGKTPVSFDPFNTVTRGQMATFIWRAEKADRGNPVYAVGDIVGDQIYINGVAYTVASHLRTILNATNKNVLQGAYIEGDFSGKTLQNISKLTINASGNSSRLLALDGGYSSFAGELIVNGSYVRLKNINFTGRVEVAEAPRRSLAALGNSRIASIGNVASFIDWGKPTVPKNEDFLNPVENETLQDKPDPNKPAHLQKYTERMSNLKKYVDFENSDVRHLYVSSDRTFVKANYEIDRLTLQGNVANVELYASPNAMYIDTDYNVSIFGVHDIRYVYKNTLKNVFFNTDSTYDYYYITSSNGFTDIGPHVYISTAIIPPNKTVNDVFDDYKTDNPNIGYIEDENGKAVDRDPVENTIISDVTGPKITQLDVAAGGSTADVTLKADEDGTYYYVIKRADEKAPSINEIKTGGTKYNGNGPIVMDEPVKFTVSGLETLTDYVIYAIVIDKADNVSEKESQEFSTIDNRPPTFRLDKGETMYGGKRVQFIIKGITEPGEYYYYIREKSPVTMPDPTVDEIMKRYTGKGTITKPEDVVITETKYGAAPAIGEIKPNTEYEIYAVMVDKSGNKMRNPAPKITIKTEGPDLTQPYVANEAKLNLVDEQKGIFEFEVSEGLDPKTALDPKNYTLSGTGILNVSGQKTINPTKVEISGKRVRLTIPALNALVKGDTIRVTVSKNVLDLAENEFEHIDRYPENQNAPRNEAYYVHVDNEVPKIEIKKVLIESNRNLVEFVASKAGTYYYMILEDNYDFEGKEITPRDFVDEFESKNINETTKFGERGRKDYTGNLLNQYGPAELNLNSKSINIDFDSLNPFKSYSVYMVLKDRAGLLSQEIVSMPIVADSKAPLISDLKMVPQQESDEGVTISFTADEAGDLLVIPVRKYILNEAGEYILNSKFFEMVGGEAVLKPIPNVYPTTSSDAQRTAFNTLATEAGGKQTVKFNKGINSSINITELNKHQEYGFYIAADDTKGEKGNFTIFQRSNEVSNPPSPNEPNGDQMIRYAYTDGIKPYITNDDSKFIVGSNEGIIHRNLDGTFTITFNEAIMREKNTNKTTLTSSTSLSSILMIEGGTMGSTLSANDFTIVKYELGATTTSKSKLTIRPRGTASVNQNIIVTMKNKPEAYDYFDQNEFDLSKLGKYVYPGSITNTIDWVSITAPYSPPKVDPTGNSSKTISVDLDSTIAIANGQRYYYAVSVGPVTLTEKEIMDYVRSTVVNDETDKIYIGGTGTITTSSQLSDFIPIENKGEGYFKVGHYFHLFTIDDFGNVTWATNPATPTRIQKIVP
ncbi:S-layer homology domain-containing protein [Solibacillus silvestris]|uniref:S-layer homology domain-containing protein n=1 Tax=Solibacillus silvestris TaxID=76853 RepID=UPI003F7D1B60